MFVEGFGNGPKGPARVYDVMQATKALAWKRKLASALERAHSDQLTLLGKLFKSKNLVDKINCLRELIDHGADIRIIEAGVRQMYFSQYGVDFPKLSLDDPSHASVIVFHPEAPVYLLNCAFIRGFENALDTEHRERADFWEVLIKAAFLTLTLAALIKGDQGARECLREDIDAIRGNDAKTVLMGRFKEWAKGKMTLAFITEKDEFPVIEKSEEELENYLHEIENDNIEIAFKAAVNFLTYHDYIRTSALID